MKQLTGLDATFLHLETPHQFGHVAGLAIFSRPEEDPDYEPYSAWKARVAERLHQLPPLRRRLAEVPLGIDHPFWVEDPDFDLDFHVRHSAVPPPGRLDQLAASCSRMIARPLDRRHPLWLSYVIEGLEHDRFAVLTIFHHATIDGASGVELLTTMLDTSPDVEADPPPDTEWIGERVPSDLELAARGTLGLIRKPARALLLAAETAREIGTATRNPALVLAAKQVRRGLNGPVGGLLNAGRAREQIDVPSALPNVRPERAPFNAPITSHRAVAIGTASLEDIKAIKRRAGVSVNDVVMAVCAGGLRRWLQRHDALPEGSLSALIPVSIRTGDEPDRWTNRVSMLLARLPTDVEDPIERLRLVHEGMRAAKGIHDAMPAERLTEFAQFPPPAVFATAMRLSARLRITSRLTPGNLVISNVPGPREPLYAAGAKLEGYFPLSVVLEGQALNITVQSYLDRLDFGLVCCPEVVPDVDGMLDAILEELASLRKLAPEPEPEPAEA